VLWQHSKKDRRVHDLHSRTVITIIENASLHTTRDDHSRGGGCHRNELLTIHSLYPRYALFISVPGTCCAQHLSAGTVDILKENFAANFCPHPLSPLAIPLQSDNSLLSDLSYYSKLIQCELIVRYLFIYIYVCVFRFQKNGIHNHHQQTKQYQS